MDGEEVIGAPPNGSAGDGAAGQAKGNARRKRGAGKIKAPAHPKATGGGGFAFEDQAVAYFLASLLAGRSIFGPDAGRISRVSFQARPSGWLFDDVVVEFQGGSVGVAGVSIKSGRYVTSGGVPEQVALDGWSQLLGEASSPFVEGKDLMVVVTSPLSIDVREDLQELIRWATHLSSSDLAVQVQTRNVGSALKRQLFDSLRCPDDLSKKHASSASDAGRLVRHLRFVEFDFQDATSEDLADAVAICQDCLRNKNPGDAGNLWETLCGIAREYRPNAGSLDLRGLVARLGSRFDLADHPDYAEDWTKLRQWSAETSRAIPRAIGGRFRLDRSEFLRTLQDGLEASPHAVVLAPSGYGKSVVAGEFADLAQHDEEVLFIDARSQYLAPNEVESHLRLGHPLGEVLRNAVAPKCLLIVDAVEQTVAERDFIRLGQLLSALESLDSAPGWRLMLVCQGEGWERVRRELGRTNDRLRDWKEIDLPLPCYEELAPVWASFPGLRPLGLRDDLRQVLWKPKVLDLMARAVLDGRTPDVESWVGESNAIKWFWVDVAQAGTEPLARSRALRRIGEIQGDELLALVHADRLDSLSIVERLVDDRLLDRDGESVRFTHDLYGDWSRLRQLLEQGNRIGGYLSTRATSPFWHRAIRLYGVHLLEQEGPDVWIKALHDFGALDQFGDTLQDLLLEALVFAADPATRLRAVWTHLTAQDGVLLRRFLGRFLAVATRPDPQLLDFVSPGNLADWLRAAGGNRVPEWPEWVPVLGFLSANGDTLVTLAPQETASLCECWLCRGRKDWPEREGLARIAVQLATGELDGGFRDGDMRKDIAESSFSAALAGLDELPAEVRELSLRACGRTGEPEIKADFERDGQQWVRSRGIVLEYELPLPDPWPEGPIARHNKHFARVCLEDFALGPVIESDPWLATEILLALLIRPRKPTHPDDHTRALLRDLGLVHGKVWYPAFWWHCPLPLLFTKHPAEAVDFVIRLVHFASERWADQEMDEGRTAFRHSVMLDGSPRELVGDGKVYYWFRSDGNAPPVVASALMALEWYLYRCEEKGEDYGPILDQILEATRSVALAGVLSAFAAKTPDLYKGRLSFLLFDPLIYRWEQRHQLDSGLARMIAWTMSDEEAIKSAQEWHGMPHRKEGIPFHGPRLLLFEPLLGEQFDEARVRWGREREEALTRGAREHADGLERMMAIYDRANYYLVETDDGRQALQYRHPEHLEQRLAPEAEEAGKNLKSLLFPWKCAQRIDGQDCLTIDELELFWLELQSLVAPPEGSPIQLADALCGGAAVLLLLHREWLKRHPDREEWCVEALLQTVEGPPEPTGYDCAESVSDNQWVHFCARAVPLLWGEDPGSQRRRCAVARLCTDFRYVTIRLLTSAVFCIRGLIGQDHLRFWHFVRACAVERSRFAHARMLASRTGARPGRSTSLTPSPAFIRTFEAFVRGSLAATLPTLPQPVPPKVPPEQRNAYREVHRARPRVDVAWLFHAALGLPELDQLAGTEDRAQVIRAHEEVLDLLVADLQQSVFSRGDTADEYGDERDVLGYLPLLVGKMLPEEAPERIFAMILGLGPRCADHISTFLGGWFIAGVHGKIPAEAFERVWRAMVEWTWTSDAWRGNARDSANECREMWRELMGLDWVYRDSWSDKHAPIVGRMKPLFERWTREHLAESASALDLALFARTPAGRALLPDLLCRFREASRDSPKYWQTSGLADAMARALAASWDDAEALRRNPVAFESFKVLLAELCDLQNPLALQLREAVRGV